jgi:hypothetical protein
MRLGVVGCGNISLRYHLPACQNTEGVQLVLVATPPFFRPPPGCPRRIELELAPSLGVAGLALEEKGNPGK